MGIMIKGSNSPGGVVRSGVMAGMTMKNVSDNTTPKQIPEVTAQSKRSLMIFRMDCAMRGIWIFSIWDITLPGITVVANIRHLKFFVDIAILVCL